MRKSSQIAELRTETLKYVGTEQSIKSVVNWNTDDRGRMTESRFTTSYGDGQDNRADYDGLSCMAVRWHGHSSRLEDVERLP